MNTTSSPMKTKKAVHRLIDSVWTIEYRVISQNPERIEIVRYSRDDKEGYANQHGFPHGVLIEDGGRTVIGASIKGRHCIVTNPRHVFDYNCH